MNPSSDRSVGRVSIPNIPAQKLSGLESRPTFRETRASSVELPKLRMESGSPMQSFNPTIEPQRLRQLLHRLIDIYSPSGKEEEITSFVQAYLKRHGLTPVQQNVEGNRHNLLILPPGGEIRLALVGHLDTVMAYDLEDFGHEEHDDLIVGLGAADMKGGCAAMIEAYIAFCRNAPVPPPVALALVVGEEEEGDGARKLAREYHFPWAVIGEPTSIQPCFSDYGYIEVHITTRGKRRHASLANLGQNPIDTMLRLLLSMSQYVETQRSDITFNIRELSSSQSGFAVPERCDAWLDIHLPPTAPMGEITLEIEEIFDRMRNDTPDFNGFIRFETIHTGYELPQKGIMADILKKIYTTRSIPWNPRAFPSHSDANILWAAGMKPILLGPGELEKAHAPDEAVLFEDVLLAAQVYLDLLISYSS